MATAVKIKKTKGKAGRPMGEHPTRNAANQRKVDDPFSKPPHGGMDPDGFQHPDKPDYSYKGQSFYYNRNIDVYEVHVLGQYYGHVYVTCGSPVSDVEARAKAIFRHLSRYKPEDIEYRYIESILPDETHTKDVIEKRKAFVTDTRELERKLQHQRELQSSAPPDEADAAPAHDTVTPRNAYDADNPNIVPSFTLVRSIDGYCERYDKPEKAVERHRISRRDLFDCANKNRLTLFSSDPRRNTHNAYYKRRERYVFYTEDMFHVEHLGVFQEIRDNKPSPDEIQISLAREMLEHMKHKERQKQARQHQRENALKTGAAAREKAAGKAREKADNEAPEE